MTRAHACSTKESRAPLGRSLRGFFTVIAVIALLLVTTVVRAQSPALVPGDDGTTVLAPVTATPTTARAAPSRPPPALVGYGGFGARFDMALVGGFWWGVTGSVGVRWLDRLDFRVDGVASLLVPSSKGQHECGEPPCSAGLRAVLSPSIGHRIPLGTVRLTELERVALTPSIGVALGAQSAEREWGASAFDAKTPSTWMLLEPGLALSIGRLELRSHLRLPRGSVRAPMFDIGFGAAIPF